MNESLQQNYARGGFGAGLSPGLRPALLIVDFVEAYLAEGSPLYAGVESAQDAALDFVESRHCVVSNAARTLSGADSRAASHPLPVRL